jgi:hypothetical protein
MAEWSKAVDSKSTVGQLTGGSNPSLSASFGEVRERLNRRAWRARVCQKRTVGSNPTLSAHKVRLTSTSDVEDWVLCDGAL